MEENNENIIEKESSAISVIDKPDSEGTNQEEYVTQKKKNRHRIIILILAIIIVLIGIISTIFAVANIGNEKMIKGLKISQIDISNMTKDEAKKILEEIYAEKAKNEIYFVYNDFETTTTYETIEVQYEIENAIKQAYEIGRKGNIFKDNFEILKSLLTGTKVELEVTIDKDMINQVIQNINNSIEGAVVQPSYYIENDKLIITSGKAGLKVEEKTFIEEIYKIVKEENETQKIVIPLVETEPDQIDIEKIHNEVYKETQDAYYTQNPFTIYPEVNGIDFDMENAKLILTEQKEEYEIPLIITKARKTTKDLGTEAFPDLLASFSTKYKTSQVDRTTNLKLAAGKINGTVLLPNETFSYNKVVGERTVAAGYKEAATFVGGKVVDGLGGGICQISSTLYDAVVMANLNVTVRRNHQFVTSYVDAGKDATVVWGSQDFKFVNSRKNPIRLTATVENGLATIKVWGIKEEVEYDISIETKKTATIKYETQYIEDANLPEGQQVVVQEGSNGRKVEAYKVTKLNGKVVSTTLLSKDTYNAKKKIVRVGKAKQ